MNIEVKERQTRQHDMDLYIPIAESENHKKMFFYRAARSWNNLPSYLKECTNLDNFKKSLKYYIRNAAHDLI